jgi:RNA polymerase sigma factor (sigma-70 family)
MPERDTGGIARYLQRVVTDSDGRSDRDLLTTFIANRDPVALDALIRRHSAMVWGVCVRVLSPGPDAEDAFQAAFLVLVRRAAAVRDRDLLANWLYGVARQTAKKGRSRRANRWRREHPLPDGLGPSAPPARDNDLAEAVDREIDRLGAGHRAVIVLCDLEGRTSAEAARQLGVAEGTVASRLARARAELGRRLIRLGSAGAAAAVSSTAGAAVPPSLLAATLAVAPKVAAGGGAGAVPASVRDLTQGVLNVMFLPR